MQRFFDTKKQQGKTVDIFAAKKTQIDLTSPDRNVSPFRGYKQAPSPSLARNQEVSVSRGIFSSKKDPNSSDVTPHARYTIGNESMYGNYSQVFQDFLNNELKSQMGHFRNEMAQLMNDSLKEFREKANKNQETVVAIKDSIKNNSHNIEKLDEKIEEYHSSLEMISTMFQSEIEKIKNNLPHYKGKADGGDKAQQDQRLQKLESDIQEVLINVDKLKDELTQSVQYTLEEYGQVSEQESNNRINKIAGDISTSMEQRIDDTLEHINGKIAGLEKQIQSKSEDSNAELAKLEREEKLNEQIQALRQQVQGLYQMMETATIKSDEAAPNKESSPEKERRSELSRFEYDSLKLELTAMVDQVKLDGKGFNTRLETSEKKLNEELNQLRDQIQKYQAESGSSSELLQSRDEFEKKLIIMEKRLDEIRQEQRDLNSNISIQKAQLESFKTTTAITMNDIKANQSQIEEVHLKKLDQSVEDLTKSIASIKTSASLNDSLTSTKFSEGSSNPKLENFNSFGYPASTTASQAAEIQVRPGLEGYRNEQHSYEQAAGNYQRGYSSGYGEQGKETRISPEKKPSSEDFASSYLPAGTSFGSGNKRDSLYPSKEPEHTETTYGSGKKESGLGEPRPWEKTEVHKTLDYSSPVKGTDRDVQTITVPTAVPTEKDSKAKERKSVDEANDEDEVEVVYQIDENGYLMDEDGNYIYDDKGEMIKLNDDQIDRLRENNLLEEENQ